MNKKRAPVTYADAGVDRKAAAKAMSAIKERVKDTLSPEVLGGVGHFGGLFHFDPERFQDPVLVSATDGVGTKVMVAEQAGVLDTIGIDLVAMSVNDVAAMGAEPLFFLDYIVVGKLDPAVVDQLVAGIVEGCREAGCVLLGGETAEHPGHLPETTFDLSGFCVGAASRASIVDGSKIKEGDVVLGLESTGVHSNGFSLIRKVLFDDMGLELTDRPLGGGQTLGEELLKPTAIYSPATAALLEEAPPHGLAHITGGGLTENVERVIPAGLFASIDRSTWSVPAIFELISRLGGVATDEMLGTFNMGIGMVVITSPEAANKSLDAVRALGFKGHEIGSVEAGGDGVKVIYA